MSSGEGKCVAVTEVQSFVERCMIAVGTDPQHCKALSQVLGEADIRGHLTHGLHRLGNTSFRRKGFPFLSSSFQVYFLCWEFLSNIIPSDNNRQVSPVRVRKYVEEEVD